MTQYEITLIVDSTTPPEELRQTLDRIIEHTFGSSGYLDNMLELDDDLDVRCCHCQATDDHNETVARQAGCVSYTRTDGKTIELVAP